MDRDLRWFRNLESVGSPLPKSSTDPKGLKRHRNARTHRLHWHTRAACNEPESARRIRGSVLLAVRMRYRTGQLKQAQLSSAQESKTPAMQWDQDQLKVKLAELELEHRDLDDVINNLIRLADFDQIKVGRLKKRKLALKDQITSLRGRLIPDIIA